MALPTTYLAADRSAADRRSRALHRFIVASPIVLLLAVGLVGHLRHPRYAGSAGSSDYDRRVLAYRDRVIAAQAMPQDDLPPLAPYEKEARRWVAGFQAGELTPLTPVAYEDHLRDGVRGEVFRAGIMLASGLSAAAERRVESGDPAEGADAALVAAQLASGLRAFELQACLQAMLVQRRAIGIVARTWPSLSVEKRNAIRKSLVALRFDPKEIDGLSRREDDQMKDYVQRQRLSPAGQTKDAGFGEQVMGAIRRSVRLSNERIAALLQDEKTPTAVEELP